MIAKRPRVIRGGFTLIEILSVVIIIGIVSAIILPQIDSRDDQRVASAARQVMADLLYAQSRSIALQKMHYVQFNTATNTYQVLDQVSPSNHVINNPVGGAAYTQTVGTGALTNVAINSAGFDGQTTLAFDAMGTPYSWSSASGAVALNSGTIVLKAGTNKLTISVGAYTGEVTVH